MYQFVLSNYHLLKDNDLIFFDKIFFLEKKF